MVSVICSYDHMFSHLLNRWYICRLPLHHACHDANLVFPCIQNLIKPYLKLSHISCFVDIKSYKSMWTHFCGGHHSSLRVSSELTPNRQHSDRLENPVPYQEFSIYVIRKTALNSNLGVGFPSRKVPTLNKCAQILSRVLLLDCMESKDNRENILIIKKGGRIN